jgi:hypothetical protein
LKELKIFKEKPRGSKNMRPETLAFLGLLERPFLYLYIERAFEKGLITGLISEFIKMDFVLTLFTQVTQLSKREVFKIVNGIQIPPEFHLRESPTACYRPQLLLK